MDGQTPAQPPVPPANGLTPGSVSPPPPSGMAKPAVKPAAKHGHNFLLLYVVILLIAFVSGGVYAWQNSRVKKLNQTIASQNSQIKTLKGQVSDFENSFKNGPANRITGPYAGWKTFCDTQNGACFDYPSNWTISGSSSNSATSESVASPKNTAQVSYQYPYSKDKLDQVYYINEIDTPQESGLGVSIVGRAINNNPDYVTVDSSYIDSNGITGGKSVSFENTARFTDRSKKGSVQFVCAPSSSTVTTLTTSAQATAWFQSEDAKNCLKILQSFYYQ